MKTVIIHTKSQTDREPNILELFKNYDEITIFNGIVPNWVKDKYDRAVLGCSLSHINIIERNINEKSLLILEDDASLIQENAVHVLSSEVPADAGIIIMGGVDLKNYKAIPYENTIYHEITPPFYGTQAVWYNTELLKNTNFLLNAYKTIASTKIGKDGICLESILMQSLLNTGLKIYKPDKMLYSIIECVSLRTGTTIKPNLSAF